MDLNYLLKENLIPNPIIWVGELYSRHFIKSTDPGPRPQFNPTQTPFNRKFAHFPLYKICITKSIHTKCLATSFSNDSSTNVSVKLTAAKDYNVPLL